MAVDRNDTPRAAPRPPWRRKKAQEDGKNVDEQKAAPSEVRRVLGKEEDSSPDDSTGTKASSDETTAPPEPEPVRPLCVARMKNQFESPLASVGQLAAQRSIKFRKNRAEETKGDTSSKPNDTSSKPKDTPVPENRQPVAENNIKLKLPHCEDSKMAVKEDQHKDEGNESKLTSPKPPSSPGAVSPTHIQRRSKPDASAGIAALVAGFGGAFPGQPAGKKGKVQLGHQLSNDSRTSDKQSDTSAEQSFDNDKTSALEKEQQAESVKRSESDPSMPKTPGENTPSAKTSHLTRPAIKAPGPIPVSPKPRRRQIHNTETPKQKEAEVEIKKITPSGSPVLSRRFIPQPSPKPSPRPTPRQSRANSPQPSPRYSPILTKKILIPRSDSPTRFGNAEGEVLSPGSPIRPRSPLVKSLFPTDEDEAAKMSDADSLSMGSVGGDSILSSKSEVELKKSDSMRSGTEEAAEKIPTRQKEFKVVLKPKKRNESLDLDLPMTLPRLNVSAGRFRSSLSAKGGLANRRKPTRALLRQAHNQEGSGSEDESKPPGAHRGSSSSDKGSVDSSDTLENKKTPFKKKFPSLNFKLLASEKSRPAIAIASPDSSTPTSPKAAPAPPIPAKPKPSDDIMEPKSPRPRAKTMAVAGARPLGPPLIADLQKSPMMRRRYRGDDEVDGGMVKKEEEKESVSSDTPRDEDSERSKEIGSLSSEPPRDYSPSFGSMSHTPSLSSEDMLNAEESDEASTLLGVEHLERPASGSSSRFQVTTAFDWDSKDVLHWLQHKLKRDDLREVLEEHCINGEVLMALDPSQMKALGVTNSKDQGLLKKEIKTLKSQAAKSRKEEKKRLENEKKLEQKRQKAAEKEARKKKT